MIIEGLLGTIAKFLNLVLIFEIPLLPDSVLEYFSSFVELIGTGASVLANYTPLGYLLILMGIMIAVDVAVLIYKVVMWILRKIPVLGIS